MTVRRRLVRFERRDLRFAPEVVGVGRRRVVTVAVDDHASGHTADGTKTSPRIRAAPCATTPRTRPRRRSPSTLHVKRHREVARRVLDVEHVVRAPCAASSNATEPGTRQAVATDTAPKTPIASCTRWGMKVRVLMTPPCCAGGEQTHLGHRRRRDVAEVHPRSRREAQPLHEFAHLAIALDGERLFVTGQSELLGLQTDDRHAVVDAGDANPFDDVERRAPSAATSRTIEPATSRNSIAMGACVPGTPSMCVSPS